MPKDKETKRQRGLKTKMPKDKETKRRTQKFKKQKQYYVYDKLRDQKTKRPKDKDAKRQGDQKTKTQR